MTKKFIVREYKSTAKVPTWRATSEDYKETVFEKRAEAIEYLEKVRKEAGKKEYYEVTNEK
ncbi:hypothetical protein KJR27_03475 [Streptococcus infantarius subsp. infantarius]|uniref:hypothetical protein n=1 Tax=Streptococcus infantarius TaxID=102684 RepID=UPI001BDA5B97|nr:hypothetical protein [Streptococcus infantarius]MBT0931672.1 hypothetical protein [Streptococcus infantarius subsp. infantarius]